MTKISQTTFEPDLKFTEAQATEIIDKVVPLIAAPADYEFFKGVLHCKAQDSTAPAFSAFIAKLLKE